MLIEGRLKTESWKSAGQRRSKLKVVADRLERERDDARLDEIRAELLAAEQAKKEWTKTVKDLQTEFNATHDRIAAKRKERPLFNMPGVDPVNDAVKVAIAAETGSCDADVIDGVKFLATLDTRISKTCFGLHGTIWGPDEMDQVQRPPLHPNCRSQIIPYIDLGKEFDGTEPAEARNFLLDAKQKYNAEQERKGSGKRFDDLSYEYRHQLRRNEMKSYKERTGRNPYRQVSSRTTATAWFETLSERDKREWLGAVRYEAYKAGELRPDELGQSRQRIHANDRGLETCRQDSGLNRTQHFCTLGSQPGKRSLCDRKSTEQTSWRRWTN